jgi:hypothetical protein
VATAAAAPGRDAELERIRFVPAADRAELP